MKFQTKVVIYYIIRFMCKPLGPYLFKTLTSGKIPSWVCQFKNLSVLLKKYHFILNKTNLSNNTDSNFNWLDDLNKIIYSIEIL